MRNPPSARLQTLTKSAVAFGVAAALALEPAVAAAQASAPVAPLTVAGPATGVPASLFKPKKKKGGGKKRGGGKKKKKPAPEKTGPDLTPNDAEGKREAIREAAQGDVDAGDYAAAAQTMEDNAAQLGDPISFLEAADLRIRAAEKERDVSQAEAAIASAEIAGDIAGFYQEVDAGTQSSDWLVIDPAAAGDLSARADSTIERAEALIEEIEAEKAKDEPVAAADGKTPKVKKQREKKPGLALIAAGSGLSVLGAAGVSMAIAGLVISSQKQKEVEGTMLPEEQAKVDQLDKEGNRANVIAFVGAGIAVVGFGVGIPLVIVGAKRRKDAKNAPASAHLRLVPKLSRRAAGLAVSGKF